MEPINSFNKRTLEVSAGDFNNKRYLITGASSGMGYAITEALLNHGAIVVGIGRDKAKTARLQAAYQEKFTFSTFDLNHTESIELLFENEFLADGKFDGLVLCAGREETLPISLYKPANVLDLFKINVFSSIEILRNFSKKKFSNDKASIVFLTSVMAELGEAGKMGYCATKSAILGVVKTAALELMKRSIRVNAVAPAIVNTPMTDKLLSSLAIENINEIKKMHPNGFGETGDIVPMILFLLSDQTRWMTGQNIKIDGGYSIR